MTHTAGNIERQWPSCSTAFVLSLENREMNTSHPLTPTRATAQRGHLFSCRSHRRHTTQRRAIGVIGRSPCDAQQPGKAMRNMRKCQRPSLKPRPQFSAMIFGRSSIYISQLDVLLSPVVLWSGVPNSEEFRRSSFTTLQ